MSDTYTTPDTYTVTDVGVVVRRLAADFLMIAQSTGCWSEAEAQGYADDIEALAQAEYLSGVDVTLLTSAGEARAVRYDVDASAGSLASRRPGGVLWPCLPGAWLRVVLTHTPAYTREAAAAIAGKLNHAWSPSGTDLSHRGLGASGGRDYASNGYALRRKDYGA